MPSSRASAPPPILIVGDDLFVSNTERLQRGIDLGAGNAILLKVNQIGTVTQACKAAELAATNGSPNQDGVAHGLKEAPLVQVANQGLVDGGSLEVDVGEFPGQGQFRHAKPVADGAGSFLGHLGLQQIAENALDTVFALEPV